MFVDDTKLYKGVSSPNYVALLQDDLNVLVSWCYLNLMTINQEKCHVVKYLVNAVAYQYSISEVVICSVDFIRDLGIIFDNQLRFDKKVSAVLHKANYSLLCIKRMFRRFNLRRFTRLYKKLIQPIVEYCTSVWYPTRKSDSQLIEKVQNLASKFVPYLKYLPYECRLRYLSLPSLQFWRDRWGIVLIYLEFLKVLLICLLVISFNLAIICPHCTH